MSEFEISWRSYVSIFDAMNHALLVQVMKISTASPRAEDILLHVFMSSLGRAIHGRHVFPPSFLLRLVNLKAAGHNESEV